MASTERSGTHLRLIYLLTVAQRRVEGYVQSRSDGSSSTRVGMLLALSPDRPTPMGVLGPALDLAAPAISNLVERAVKAGLVVRKPDPVDGRAWMISLTADGRSAREEAVRGARMVNASLAEGFDERELEVVGRWLESVQRKFPRRPDDDEASPRVSRPKRER